MVQGSMLMNKTALCITKKDKYSDEFEGEASIDLHLLNTQKTVLDIIAQQIMKTREVVFFDGPDIVDNLSHVVQLYLIHGSQQKRFIVKVVMPIYCMEKNWEGIEFVR